MSSKIVKSNCKTPLKLKILVLKTSREIRGRSQTKSHNIYPRGNHGRKNAQAQALVG